MKFQDALNDYAQLLLVASNAMSKIANVNEVGVGGVYFEEVLEIARRIQVISLELRLREGKTSLSAEAPLLQV